MLLGIVYAMIKSTEGCNFVIEWYFNKQKDVSLKGSDHILAKNFCIDHFGVYDTL